MSKTYRNLGLAVGALALLAAVAPGLAAGITVPTDGGAPAAGQGTVVLQGFTVTNIDWKVNDDEDVTDVGFTIIRSAAGAEVVTAAASETEGNAVVRVRLEGTTDEVTTNKDWVSCKVENLGLATCDIEDAGAMMSASDLERVNIIAFDRK
jgi:hypothetical protein